MCASRLHPHKPLGEAIDQASRVPGALVLVAGVGPAEDDLRSRFASVGNVRFLGHVRDVTRIYWAGDVQLLALAPTEGLPMALLEGAACALPTIAVASLDQGIVPVEAGGRVVHPGDACGVRRAIADLNAAEAGCAARRWAEQNDVRSWLDQHEVVFEQVRRR